ncbi:DUF1295 domain-containing protein [Amnibacterium flavum]|uniref:Steroid 5-alpha reductase C-terminal domain-containing protein n=1 Tax=Amnibacterium flavum TaxID=2173173 RepID=A0A2V1HVT4_9MICO|nr:DUF1295 domain-containing protein [Amnibacterium flavum]PVZ94497.1 hypothetical protein DDQ50_12400 [Amnibacterium flavum]
MDQLTIVMIVAAAVSAATWIASLITGDHSWVDRIWSIAPVVYGWIFAAGSGWDARVVLMASLITLWGARLTFNFARKGGYTGTEDYRWPVLRARMTRWQFELFNLVFIVGFQNTLLVLITTPLAVAAAEPGAAIGVWDVVLAVVFLVFLAGETLADQQQWDFHQRKAAERAAGREVRPGFLSTGLWRFSRHPNFFFEQAQWWVVYFFGVAAIGASGSLPFLGGVINISLIGPVLLTALFLGSSRFTEALSAGKYPEYASYQRTTSMLLPLPPRTPQTQPTT